MGEAIKILNIRHTSFTLDFVIASHPQGGVAIRPERF
jgi:hypothetical protein